MILVFCSTFSATYTTKLPMVPNPVKLMNNCFNSSPTCPKTMDWSKYYPAHFASNNSENSCRAIEFADIGCGYGGLLGKSKLYIFYFLVFCFNIFFSNSELRDIAGTRRGMKTLLIKLFTSLSHCTSKIMVYSIIVCPVWKTELCICT